MERYKSLKLLSEKVYKVNDELEHKKSNVIFIISSKEGDKYWLYPKGKNVNDKNAMLLSSKDIDKYFK